MFADLVDDLKRDVGEVHTWAKSECSQVAMVLHSFQWNQLSRGRVLDCQQRALEFVAEAKQDLGLEKRHYRDRLLLLRKREAATLAREGLHNTVSSARFKETDLKAICESLNSGEFNVANDVRPAPTEPHADAQNLILEFYDEHVALPKPERPFWTFPLAASQSRCKGLALSNSQDDDAIVFCLYVQQSRL